jgi:hypothetical protein
VSLLGACHAAVVPPLPVVLAVDSTVYHRQGQSPIAVGFTITNTGQRPYYVWQCDGQPQALIDRLSWGTWRFWEGGFCNGGQVTPLALSPGRAVRGVVTLDVSGPFRLRISATPDPQEPYDWAASSRGFDVW